MPKGQVSMILLPGQAMGRNKIPALDREMFQAFACSWQSKKDSVHLKDHWEGLVDPGELSAPLEPPMKLSGPGDLCRPRGTQLTSQPARSSQAAGNRQKLRFLL